MRRRDGGRDYTWLTGPRPGHGFSESGPVDPPVDEQREARVLRCWMHVHVRAL